MNQLLHAPKSDDKVRIGIHTKACTEALGIENGLNAILEAGFSLVVLWGGEEGEKIEALNICKHLGLSVLAVSLPKVSGLVNSQRTKLNQWISYAHELGAPAVSLIFGDLLNNNFLNQEWMDLCEWMNRSKLPLLIENNGRASERFSELLEIAKLIEHVSSLYVVLDIGHLMSSGKAWHNDISMLSSRVAWLEVHDNDGINDLHLPLGLGKENGSFESGLQKLNLISELIIIETNPQLGKDQQAWTNAICSDRERLQEYLMHNGKSVELQVRK